MATDYSTLGLTVAPTQTYSTVSTDTYGPSPSAMPLYPIGTGRAAGTSAVGTTIDRGGKEHVYSGPTTATQIDKLTSAPVNQSAKSYPKGIKGWIEEKIDYALAPTVEYNKVTGTYRATGPGGAITGMMGPLGGIMQGFAEITRAGLENIAAKAYAGEKGYAIGYVGNSLVGTSPGLFGSQVFTGAGDLNLQDMSLAQYNQLTESLLGLENKSGAYDPNLQEKDFANIASSGLTPEQYYDFSPNVGPYLGLTTGSPFTYSSGITGGSSFQPTSFVDPTPSADNNYGLPAGRSAVMSASGPVTSRRTGSIVTSKDYSYSGGNDDNNNDDNSDNRDNSGSGGADAGGFGTGAGEIGGLSHAEGGRIGLAPGGRADGPGSETEGNTHGGLSNNNNNNSNNDNDDRGDNRKDIARQIQSQISSAIQNKPMSVEERYASNQMMVDKSPDVETIDKYSKNNSLPDSVKPESEFGAFGFKNIGEAIGSAITSIGQYSALGALGLVPFKEGGSVTSGFKNVDPDSVSEAQSIADNRYTTVKAGSFVVNQPANEANEKRLNKIVADASKTAKMKKGGKAGMVDVALSDGERLIEPEVVAQIEKKHGKGFLDKLNNEGKPEVTRRQAKYGEKIGAAHGGGFLADQGMEHSDVGEDTPMEDYLPVSDELKAKLSKFAAKKPQRGQIKQFIKSLSPEDKLTVLFLTETQSTTDPLESMEAIGEVVKNRIGSNYYDFKDIKTLDDALLKQTRKGAFHFSGLEPSTLYARAKEVKKGLADKGLAKAYAAAQNVLDPETEGASRLPANTVFYTRKDAPSQWMRESKDLEFSTELGEHEFYRTFAAPELP